MAARNRTLGIGDRPVSGVDGDGDLLGIGGYATALREFVSACDTPLTIGIQGDWGSGKTSLMNLIRVGLDDQCASVWINTWKYAQLGDPETLFLAVLEGVVDGLEACAKGSTQASRLRGLLGHAAKGAWAVGKVALKSQGVDLSDVAAPDAKPHQMAEELKTGLAKMVEEVATRRDRVVLFVDDLDRIPPVRAVQILEALKNFLDVPGLVTVLACDYAVISQGLGQRFGVCEADIGRSFFDKIIQVPFRMPVHAYQADSYVRSLLARVDVKVTDGELVLVTEVLRTSVGLNPRSLKRHANTLLLLLKVANQTPSLRKTINTGRRPLFMLALTSMEACFPEVHRFLTRKLGSPEGDAQVRSLLMEGQLPDPGDAPWAEKYLSEEGGEAVVSSRLRLFLIALRALVDVDGDRVLSAAELAVLKEMALLSSISSVGEVTEPAPRRTKITQVGLLDSMPEYARRIGQRLFDEARRRPRLMTVYLGSRGASVRVKAGGKLLTLLYIMPPGTHQWDVPFIEPSLSYLPEELQAEARSMYDAASAGLEPAGKLTLRLGLRPETLDEADRVLDVMCALADEVAG